jgi:hypothetical protein
MSVALLGVRYKSDKRGAYLHHSNWLLKLGAWVLFNALPFFFPNSLVNAYGEQRGRGMVGWVEGGGIMQSLQGVPAGGCCGSGNLKALLCWHRVLHSHCCS